MTIKKINYVVIVFLCKTATGIRACHFLLSFSINMF